MKELEKMEELVLQVLLNYLPGLRDPVRRFLVALRDWPVQPSSSSSKLYLAWKASSRIFHL